LSVVYSAPQEICDLAQSGIVKHVADIEFAGIAFVNGKSDFSQRQ